MFSPQFISKVATEWRSVLTVLGYPAEGYRLPTEEVCPCCKAKRLQIFDDKISKRQWHYCRQCRTRGDMVTLAAKAWSVDYSAAAKRLLDSGAISEEGLDLGSYTTTWARFDNLLSTLRTPTHWNTKDLVSLIKPLVTRPLETREFSNKLGWFLTACDRTVWEANWATSDKQAKLNVDEAKKTRLFPGKGWKHVLGLPFFDRPFRVVSMALLGREMEKEDVITRSVVETDDLGLCFHPTLFIAKPKTIFAFNDPRAMLAFCGYWFYEKSETPPVVTWLDVDKKRTKSAWKMFHGCEVILCGRKLDAATLTQAFENNFFIASTGRYKEGAKDLKSHFGTVGPMLYVYRVKNYRLSWSEALDKYLEQHNDDQIAELIYGVKMRLGTEFANFLAALSKQAYLKINAMRLDLSVPKVYKTPLADVFESEQGWQIEKDGRLVSLSDVTMFVDKIYTYSTGEVLQRGRLVYKNNEYEFSTKHSDIKKYATSIAHKTLLCAGAGMPKILDNNLFGTTVLAASTPQSVQASNDVGWNPEIEAFVTHQFKLKPGYAALVGANVDVAKFKAGNLTPSFDVLPNRLSPLLDPTANNAAIWALVTAYLHTILAPMYGQPVSSYVCTSKYKNVFAKISQALGAVEIDLIGTKLESKTQWPRTFDLVAHDVDVYPGRLMQSNPIFVLLRDRKHFIRENINPCYPQLTPKTLVELPFLVDLPAVAATMLQYIVQNVPIDRKFSLATVRTALTNWIEAYGRSAAVIQESARVFKEPDSKRIITGVTKAVELALEVPGAVRRLPAEFANHYGRWEAGNQIQLTTKTFDWILKYAAKTDQFDMAQIVTTLCKHKIVTSTPTIGKLTCLSFRKTWWDARELAVNNNRQTPHQDLV